MVSSHAVLSLALAMALTAQSRLVWAQTDEVTAVERARADFEAGLALAAQQRWAEALASFERSRATLDRPSGAFNAALALQHLGRMIDARRALRECLAMPETADDPELVRDAHALLDTVGASVVTVTLRVSPASAELRVDGARSEATGVERALELDPDHAHALTLSAPGCAPADVTLTPRPGERLTREVGLMPLPASVVASVIPTSASVLVDDVFLGRGEGRWQGPAGHHRVRFTLDGYRSAERGASLAAGERAQFVMTLERERRSIASSPWLWAGVGAAAVIVAVTLWLVLPTPDAPDSGTTGTILSGITARP